MTESACLSAAAAALVAAAACLFSFCSACRCSLSSVATKAPVLLVAAAWRNCFSRCFSQRVLRSLMSSLGEVGSPSNSR